MYTLESLIMRIPKDYLFGSLKRTMISADYVTQAVQKWELLTQFWPEMTEFLKHLKLDGRIVLKFVLKEGVQVFDQVQ